MTTAPATPISKNMYNITVKDLYKSFGSKTVLNGISFCLPYGTVARITGDSGVGKTTLLRLLCGLESPDSGEISGISRHDVSFLFQDDRLFPQLSALGNVTAVMRTGEKKRIARELLVKLGLSEKDILRRPSELSGGMCRRVAIARALAFDRPVLILDEALRGLDSDNAQNAARIIETYSVGKTVIFVTHSSPITNLKYIEIPLGQTEATFT